MLGSLLSKHAARGPVTVDEAPVAVDEDAVPGVECLSASESHTYE